MNVIARKLGNFTRLSSEDQSMLDRVSATRIVRFKPREDIIHEGRKPRVINLILEGWACRYKVLEDGRRQIIAFFLPGDMCDLNVFVLREMDHSIGAITPVVISEIIPLEFEEMMLSHPRVTQAMWWETLVAAAIQREWTVNLGQRDALERMAHLFCELFLRLQAVGLTAGNSCGMPLTQAELGDALGISAVHVNRTLQDLRSAGLVEQRDKRLIILDMVALQRAGLFRPNYLHLDHEGSHLDANA